MPACCDDDAMTAPAHAVVSRLSADFATMSEQFAKVSADLNELDRVLAQRSFTPLPAPQPAAPYPPPQPQPYIPPAAVYAPPPQWHTSSPAVPPPPPPRAPRPPRDASWIGNVLAVAGV